MRRARLVPYAFLYTTDFISNFPKWAILKKIQSLSEQIPKFFWELLSKNNFWDIIYENMPTVAILKNLGCFSKLSIYISKNLQVFEHFEFSWAVLLHKTQARQKMPRLPILGKSNFFRKTSSIFPKNNFWTF